MSALGSRFVGASAMSSGAVREENGVRARNL